MRDVLLPLLLTAAALLATAAAGKLRHPAAAVAALQELGLPGARAISLVTALVEILVAALVVVWPSVGAPAAATLFMGFALFVALQIRRGAAQSCGCLGAVETPPSRAHIALDGALAVVCIASARTSPPTLAGLAHPLTGLVLAVAAAATTWAVVAGFELVPRALGAYRRPTA